MNIQENNIQSISDNYLCSACGACNAVCNKGAISFKWSSIGRKYALVDMDICVNCGICQKVCPSIDTLDLHSRYDDMYVGNIINTYTGRAVDEHIFRNAQSGGVCTAVIKYLFDTRLIDCAIMCKMTAGKTPKVDAIVIENTDQLYLCQKSSYTFVDILSALKNTTAKKSIAIVGLPCHIEGATLLAEQFNRFSNIKYKIGLICDRTHCSGMQDALASMAGKRKKIIQWKKKYFEHNGKMYYYKDAPCVILDENCVIKKIIPCDYRHLLKDMFTTPRCRVCYDKLNIHADIVLGDPWGMSKIDWQQGESLVLTRTPIGEAIIQEMINGAHVTLSQRIDYSEVILGQHIDKKQDQREKYITAYNSLFHCKESYISKGNKIGTSSEIYENEFKYFVSRENNTYQEIQKGAKKLIRSVSPWRSALKYVLRKVKHKIRKLI